MRISDWSSDVCSSDLAWMGFTLPSALLMLGFALVAKDLSGPVAISAIHGLKIAAVALVAQALIGMARKLTPDVQRIAMAIVSAARSEARRVGKECVSTCRSRGPRDT